MHLLNTLKPTQNQLTVIAKIIASQDVPTRAAAEISTNSNLIAARNMLMKLNIITYSDTSAALTDQGQQIARDQNIVDDSGTLTDEGNQLANTSTDKGGEQTNSTPPSSTPDQIDIAPPMEGFSTLFKNIILERF